MSLWRYSLPKESSQFDETIESRVIRRMAIFMLIELCESGKSIKRAPGRPIGHAPYDAVLDGFVDSGGFLGQ